MEKNFTRQNTHLKIHENFGAQTNESELPDEKERSFIGSMNPHDFDCSLNELNTIPLTSREHMKELSKKLLNNELSEEDRAELNFFRFIRRKAIYSWQRYLGMKESGILPNSTKPGIDLCHKFWNTQKELALIPLYINETQTKEHALNRCNSSILIN